MAAITTRNQTFVSYAGAGQTADSDAFELTGGTWAADFSATWGGGTVTLQKLAGDGSTYVTAMTAWTANGTALGYLPKGTYKIAIATATAVYVQLTRVQRGD